MLVAVVALLLLLFGERKRDSFAVALVAAWTLIASVGILAITGLWDQHAQILYIPALIGLLVLAPLFEIAGRISRVPTILAIILCALLLGGGLTLERYLGSFHSLRQSLAQAQQLSPEARRLLELGNFGVYARLGQNDDLGHAIGLRGWRLACARFHQYPFQPKAVLDQVFDCASEAPVLILSPSLRVDVAAFPAWNEFVGRIESLVKAKYRCDRDTDLRVCTHFL
jgi:hypothetical protein